MEQTSDNAALPKKRRVFYFVAIILLMAAVVAACIQTKHESAAARIKAQQIVAGANASADASVQQAIQEAKCWCFASMATVALAILAWGAAVWRRENHRWVWVPCVVLLILYVLLELVMT